MHHEQRLHHPLAGCPRIVGNTISQSRWLAGVGLLALLLTGCGGGNDDEGDAGASASPAASEPTVRIVQPERGKAL